MSFSTLDEWQKFIDGLSLKAGVVEIVALKFRRAQKIYFLGWIDADLIKAGELVALTALELALKDRYGARMKRSGGKSSLRDLLKYMVDSDGLTDDQIPMYKKCSGSIVANLYETDAARKARKGTFISPPITLAEIRNSQAHGDPFDGLLWSGLLELVRDLIDYTYRGANRNERLPTP